MKQKIKIIFISIAGLCIGWGIGCLISPFSDIKLCTEYYDGEGNKLPPEAITALVRSQYVITTKEEDSIINKYFK